jgi:hypothetical protein
MRGGFHKRGLDPSSASLSVTASWRRSGEDVADPLLYRDELLQATAGMRPLGRPAPARSPPVIPSRMIATVHAEGRVSSSHRSGRAGNGGRPNGLDPVPRRAQHPTARLDRSARLLGTHLGDRQDHQRDADQERGQGRGDSTRPRPEIWHHLRMIDGCVTRHRPSGPRSPQRFGHDGGQQPLRADVLVEAAAPVPVGTAGAAPSEGTASSSMGPRYVVWTSSPRGVTTMVSRPRAR